MTIKVSVATTTYNHEAFVQEAIDSVLMQEVDFDYEHVIGEDCSTDRTREIVNGYQRQHPDVMRVLLHRQNIGGRRNMVQVLEACQGEYIALLEGDDYWTSPKKLQKQVDFLEAHPECAICFHSVSTAYEAEAPKPKREEERSYKSFYTLEDLLEGNFIPTCSVMCRRGLFGDFPQWFYTTPTGDWPYHVLNAHYGTIGYIGEIMAVHRIHAGSVWSPRGIVERRRGILRTTEIFRQNLDPKYDRILEDSIARWHLKLLNALRLEGNYQELGHEVGSLLFRHDISKAALFRAVFWALQMKLKK